MNNETLTRPTSDTPLNHAGRVPANRRTKLLVLGAALIGVGLLLSAGITARLHAQSKLVVQSQENTRPVVAVINVTRSTGGAEIILPANVRAYEETTLYSRANGYLKKWLVDIGDKVEAGPVLAGIDTPDLYQELNQSPPALEQAQTQLGLGPNTSEPREGPLQDPAGSPQG